MHSCLGSKNLSRFNLYYNLNCTCVSKIELTFLSFFYRVTVLLFSFIKLKLNSCNFCLDKHCSNSSIPTTILIIVLALLCCLVAALLLKKYFCKTESCRRNERSQRGYATQSILKDIELSWNYKCISFSNLEEIIWLFAMKETQSHGFVVSLLRFLFVLCYGFHFFCVPKRLFFMYI